MARAAQDDREDLLGQSRPGSLAVGLDLRIFISHEFLPISSGGDAFPLRIYRPFVRLDRSSLGDDRIRGLELCGALDRETS